MADLNLNDEEYRAYFRPIFERAFQRAPEMMLAYRDELARGLVTSERFMEMCETIVAAGDPYDA